MSPPDDAEFALSMTRLGPFEPAPHLAAAISGGSDSLALALLAAAWVRAAGGRLTALVVDHRLRSGSGAEARRTAGLLKDRGIEPVILTRCGPAPETAIEEAAREARYRLLGGWCRAHRVLHLLVGHTREDRAETLLLRLSSGTGVDGLAAMPAVQETSWGRVLRPLLPVARDRLRALLRRRGIDWLDDPHNSDPAFARPRLRRCAEVLAGEGLTAARLSRTAARIGEARAVLESATASFLAAAALIHPCGFVRLDRRALGEAPPDTGRRALERVIRTVGGAAYAPRRARLEPLYAALAGAGEIGPRTLGGCIVRPDRDAILVAREATADAVAVAGGGELLWDRRFRLRLSASAEGRGGLRVGALGRKGWNDLRGARPEPDVRRIPAVVGPGLPALSDACGLLEVPHLGYRRVREALVERILFAPANPVAATEFAVV